MIEINLFELVGSFAENKNLARDIRKEKIIPAIENNQKIILNFENIDATTQSFIHALISDLFRHYGFEILDNISFKSCNENVKKIINIVVEYMQQSE